MIKQLTIHGFRGFGIGQSIDFSLPNGKCGSGLNIIVGANNSGKSTIIESIKAFNAESSFSEGKRNLNAGDRIKITLTEENGTVHSLETVNEGGSEICWSGETRVKSYILPSRRYVEYEFSKIKWGRDDFLNNTYLKNRSYGISNFYTRLFSMADHKDEIDRILKRIVGQHVDWTIEQRDNGNYYAKFIFGNTAHSSEGIGDGLWSVLTICDALYDSNEKDIIVIDEPELSLHPAYQKRLMTELLEQSKTRQIIISTHSPYFINWEAIANDGGLIRTQKLSDGNIRVDCLKSSSKNKIKGLISNLNNPHILGLYANEIFFLEDNIIVTEGQEDVIFYKKALIEKGIEICGDFFGWGAGGAGNEKIILNILKDLGYKKVVAIFDGDKKQLADEIADDFPEYLCIVLPQNDVRDKNISAKVVEGIMTNNGILKEAHIDWFINEFAGRIKSFFQS